MTQKAQKKKRILWKEGDVVSIDLGDGYVGFGRVLKSPLIAFYDLRAPRPLPVEEVIRHPVLFKVWVMHYAIKKGVWPIIGHAPLDEELQKEPLFFIQDPFTTRLYVTRDGGRRWAATFEEVQGLECAAVADPHHVVERLNDHFAGRPFRRLDSLRPKPVLSEEEQQQRLREVDLRWKALRELGKKKTKAKSKKTKAKSKKQASPVKRKPSAREKGSKR